MALQPYSGPGLPVWDCVIITFSQRWIVSPAPNSRPGGTGLRMYDPRKQALGTHFSRLLRHVWVIVGLVFNPGHHTGVIINYKRNMDEVKLCSKVRPQGTLAEWVSFPPTQQATTRYRIRILNCNWVASGDKRIY
jgi:hypothetical protein